MTSSDNNYTGAFATAVLGLYLAAVSVPAIDEMVNAVQNTFPSKAQIAENAENLSVFNLD